MCLSAKWRNTNWLQSSESAEKLKAVDSFFCTRQFQCVLWMKHRYYSHGNKNHGSRVILLLLSEEQMTPVSSSGVCSDMFYSQPLIQWGRKPALYTWATRTLLTKQGLIPAFVKTPERDVTAACRGVFWQEARLCCTVLSSDLCRPITRVCFDCFNPLTLITLNGFTELLITLL